MRDGDVEGKTVGTLVLIALVFAIPFFGERGVDFVGIREIFMLAWLTLLCMSIALFRFKRPGLAVLGLISLALSGLYVCMPVLVQ